MKVFAILKRRRSGGHVTEVESSDASEILHQLTIRHNDNVASYCGMRFSIQNISMNFTIL